MITVRTEEPEDIEAIRAVNQRSFGRSQEGQLVDALRENGGLWLSVAAIKNDRLVGHIAYGPLSVGFGGAEVIGLGLGPVAVLPEYQRQGIGGKLIETGNQKLKTLGCPFIAVLGHPEYYLRYDFKPAADYGIRYQWEVPENAFMVLALDGSKMAGVSGVAKYRREFSSVV